MGGCTLRLHRAASDIGPPPMGWLYGGCGGIGIGIGSAPHRTALHPPTPSVGTDSAESAIVSLSPFRARLP